MGEEPLNTIRETSRNLIVINRRKHRDEANDVHRSLGNSRMSPEVVVNIANKLKTKSLINMSELQTLKNALMDDIHNVEVVLNVHGALRGLVRELSGRDVNKQCAAAGCCCNLALGDSKAGLAVAKAAGAYLVPALDNLTTELAVTCTWTLGNLAGSGLSACELLTSQGAVAKLTEMLRSPIEEMRDAAVYALTHFAYQLKDELGLEYLNKILQSLSSLNITDTSQLLFILSCHNDFTHRSMTEDYLLKLIHTLTVSIKKSSTQENPTFLNLVRVFANMNSQELYDVLLNNFLAAKVSESVKLMLLCDGKLSDSLFWLLGNMLNCCNYSAFLEPILS